MKVTAFIRKTSAKNNVTEMARIYFRVRDVGGVDLKAASELSINPNHWSAERQGYKPRVVFVSEQKRMSLERDIQKITHLIAEKYQRGVDGAWLKSLIEEYHHPNINARGGNKREEYLLSFQIQKYIDETLLAAESQKHHRDNLCRVLRYERFRHEVMHQRGFHLCVDSITADDIREFKHWIQEEHKYVEMYPLFYQNEPRRKVEQVRSESAISGSLYRIRTVIKYCIKQGLTKNNPFDQYQIAQPIYGDPFYLTLEERDKVYYADLSELGENYAVYRDIFMFQCLIGCRVSDLNRLTKDNIIDGCVEYIPQKTKLENAKTVRVPLNQKALDILERYKDLENALLPRFSDFGYNKKIKAILKYVGIDRMVRVIDPKTREDVARPLYEVAQLEQELLQLKEQHKAELTKYRNGYMAEIDKAIKRAEVAERKIIAHEATIEKQKQRIETLDRKANPHRYRLSSGATLTGIRMSPRHSNIPSLRIQTKVGNETFEDAKYFEWYNPVIQKYLNGELTEYELVNEVFEPFEQLSQVQAQLLGATFEMLSGGPAQTHVGTGGGGSSSDMTWGEKKNDNNLTTPRRKR